MTVLQSLVGGWGVALRLGFATAACLSLIGMASAQVGGSHVRKPTYIPAEGLGPALQTLAMEYGLQIVYVSEEVNQHRTQGASGDLTIDEALTQVLRGTGLTYRFEDPDGVTILPSAREAKSRSSNPADVSDKRSGKQQNAPTTDANEGNETRPDPLEEVLVTANRRTETVQSAAMSITALTAAEIRRTEISGMDDYLDSIVGVSHMDIGVGRNATVIRGISLSPQDEGASSGQTVGYYFGEVPLSDLSWSPPDIKLIDMDRVELLRGPQGTLYGGGSLSGAIRNIPASPNLGEFSGELAASYSDTARLGSDDHNAHAVLNIPLISNTLAVRLVGYRFDDSGYVQNIAHSDNAFLAHAQSYGAGALALDRSDIGHDWYSGGRISALWHPRENFNLTFTYLTQIATQQGLPEVQLGLGLYSQARLQMADEIGGGDEFLGSNIHVGNLLASYDFSWATLVSSTSYSNQLFLRRYGIDALEGGAPTSQRYGTVTHGFNQELRLVSKLSGPFKYVGGLYYQRITFADAGDDWYEGASAENPYGGFADAYRFTDNVYLSQKAAFGELSYTLLNKLTFTAGLRRSEYGKTITSFATGPLNDGTSLTTVGMTEKKSAAKGSISYSIRAGAMIYGEFSQGFRFGMPLTPYPASCNDGTGHVAGTDVPISGGFLKSDSLNNYELGGKFTLADSRVQINTALYRIDWKNLPTLFILPTCNFAVYENAGQARSEGIEMESRIAVLKGLVLNLNGSLQHAYLTGNNPGIGPEGARLPGSPKYQYSAGLEYAFTAFHLPAYLHGEYVRLGGFYTDIQRLGPQVGDYGELNVKAGITWRDADVAIFGNNLTNAANLTWYDTNFENGRATRLRPRTVGLELRYHF